MDVLTREQRRRNMRAIRARDTAPELLVRSLVHRMGYRFRLHCRQLPGSPDLVLRSRGAVIFVHGCFWHMHACRFGRVRPATHASFWDKKRSANVVRDRRVVRSLRRARWRVFTVWECQTRHVDELQEKLRQFLDRPAVLTVPRRKRGIESDER